MKTNKRWLGVWIKKKTQYMWLLLCCLTYILEPAESSKKVYVHSQVLSLTKNAIEEVQVAITRTGIVTTFWFNSSNTKVATYTFDYCDVMRCSTKIRWQCERYIPCPGYRSTYICLADTYWGFDCAWWGAAGWNTEIPWGYVPYGIERTRDVNGKTLQQRMMFYKSGTCSLRSTSTFNNMKFTLSITNPNPKDVGWFLMGTWLSRETLQDDPGQFRISDIYNSEEWASQKNNPSLLNYKPQKGLSTMADPTFEDTITAETGYADTNMWLEWMKFSADQINKTDCYVCGHARPHLGTVPLEIPETDLICLLQIYSNQTVNPAACQPWLHQYPVLTNLKPLEEQITIYPGNYTCYYNYGSPTLTQLGNFSKGYCGEYSNKYSKLLQTQVRALGDVYWLCGDMKLRIKLPTKGWSGQCALAKAIMPFHVMSEHPDNRDNDVPSHGVERVKRDTQPRGSFDPHVYIDAIGVPRGVPDEFKARDQVKAGFEALIPIVTISKTVDWVNYLYYNQQRFINYTRDALKGLAEQLGPTSTMTFQNRMALDMILAEKGGVCKMLEGAGSCCTYIPDNTGPTGKVTQAIKKLDDLANELKQNSGITDPWDQYFSGLAGWKQILMQIGLTILVVLIIIILTTSCLIPCLRKLLLKMASSVTSTTTLAYMDEEDLDKPEETMPTLPLVML